MAPAVAAPEYGQQSPNSLKALGKAALRRWRTGLAMGLLFGIAGAFCAWYFYPMLYSSSALIAASMPEAGPFEKTESGLSSKEELELFQREQIILLRRMVPDAMRSPEVRETVTAQTLSPAQVERRLNVGYQDGTQTLVISWSDQRPDDLAVVLNAIKDAYLKEAKLARTKQIRSRKKVVEDLIQDSRTRLLEMRKAARQLNNTTTSNSNDPLQIPYSDAQRELIRTQTELLGKKNEVAIYQDQAAIPDPFVAPALAAFIGGAIFREQFPMPDESAIEKLVVLDPEVVAKQKAIEGIEQSVENLRAVLNPETFKVQVIPLNTQLAAAVKALEESRGKARIHAVQSIHLRQRDAALKNLREAESKLKMLLLQEANWKTQVEARKPTPKLPQDEADHAKMEIEQAEAKLRILQENFERYVLEELIPPKNFGTLQDAETPTQPDRATFVRRIILYGTIGFLLGFLTIGIWELMARRLVHRDDVLKVPGLRVIADLPLIPKSKGWRVAQINAMAGFVEALSTLRAILLLADGGTSRRVLMVTSAVQGEGKTTLACHLAHSIARANIRTLLIDGDLTRPRLHDLFGVPQGPGLSEIICGLGSLSDLIRPTSLAGLSFLPAGYAGVEATNALHNESSQQLFKVLRQQWEMIIIDTSPVLATSEALLFGRHADAALVALRSGVSVAPCVRLACERLAEVQIEILGAVLTGIRARSNYYTRHYRTAQIENAVVPLNVADVETIRPDRELT